MVLGGYPCEGLVGDPLLFWSIEWWVFAFLYLGVLLALLLLCYVMTWHFTRMEEKIYADRDDLDPDYLDLNPMELTSVEPNDLYRPAIYVRGKYLFWSRWATRLFVAIVLSCASFYLASSIPELSMPPLPTASLQIFIYASALLYYKTWRRREGA